ncbi:AEC family transporter [Thalassotalea profundi]|uniref:Malonate transporter n=1 Tax=Thalassotalea profundi TaxID=2036687 RepID=A0ABQ3IGB9_9GAMM|nr:AEC family transporter [Thalassotalea profundi]GHE77057.1 malonate transporter [Thalassotalea profundi]
MNVIEIIFPLALICALGYSCAKLAWLSKQDIDAISKLTFKLLIPIFLFQKMSTAQLAGNVNINYFLAFYGPLLLTYTIAFTINYCFHGIHKRHSAPSGVFALGASYSNTVIVGIPVLLAAFGDKAISLVFLIITFHSALLFTITGVLGINNNSQNASTNTLWSKLAQQTVFNPLVASITLGLIVNLLPINLPTILNNALILLGSPAIALALFLLGCSLTFYRIRQQKYFIIAASIIKLILLPTLVYITSKYLLQLPFEVICTLVIISSCPTGVNAYLIAKSQNIQRETVAGTIVASTLGCLITIPCWLWFLSMDKM